MRLKVEVAALWLTLSPGLQTLQLSLGWDTSQCRSCSYSHGHATETG